MTMKSEDLRQQSKEQIRTMMQEAIRDGDQNGYVQAFEQMCDLAAEAATAKLEQAMADRDAANDTAVLAARGFRQLTSEERKYYTQVLDAMRAANPKQAIENLNLSFPQTIFKTVFDDLQENHPLLSRINFRNSGGNVRMLLDTSGKQSAVWGEMCDGIVKELLAGFKVIDTGLYKLSAFIPVCKPGMELAPEWLDDYVRRILYESIAVGMEDAIVDGDGNNKPIGMSRDVSDNVTVTGGVYPRKAAVTVTSLDLATMGNLVSLLTITPGGRSRRVSNLILVVNPTDYYSKVMPATMIMDANGAYHSTLPYPVEIIESAALEQGHAILGMANKYAAFAGIMTGGRIDYSDEYRYLEDQRVYLIKTYANGRPYDNNAFVNLDISGLQPAVYKTVMVTPAAPSSDATLADLKVGALTLSPAFDPDVNEYTAATTNATNTITATPADAGSVILIAVNDVEITNGAAATWQAGSNTVEVNVTAADGTSTATYTVTVTKS